MVRKSTIHRNPIGSTSEALQRQRSRQSLRRQIMDNTDLSMNTESLLEFNPKLADVSHTTRIAYAKFMTSKIKKEIKFEESKVQIENEKVRARESKAFNKFKMNAGILKKTVEQSVEANAKSVENHEEPSTSSTLTENEESFKDFRTRTPIEEDPNEDVSTPDRSLTPENLLDESVPSIDSPPMQANSSTPKSTPSPSSTTAESRKAGSPIVKMKSQSVTPEQSVKSPEPPVIKSPDLSKTDEEDEDDDEEEETKSEKPRKNSTDRLNVPSTASRPIVGLSTGDKGKSKITGKTLTGWI